MGTHINVQWVIKIFAYAVIVYSDALHIYTSNSTNSTYSPQLKIAMYNGMGRKYPWVAGIHHEMLGHALAYCAGDVL